MKNPDPTPMLFRILFACLFIFISAELLPQETETCAEKLKKAQSFFEKGQVEEVPALLKDCLKPGFKKEEALSAYKLIIQTFLLNDKMVEADSTMYEFLRKYPEYQLSPTDHSSFVYLYNNFKVKPVVQITLHAGTNMPFLTSVSENQVGGKSDKSSYSSSLGNLFFSLESKFKISEKIEAGIEVGFFSQLQFSNKYEHMSLDGSKVFAVSDYTESQQRLEIPLFLTYNFASTPKITAYARAGAGFAYRLSVTSTASLNYTDPNNLNDNRTGESLKRKDSRVALDMFGQIGAGVKYKIPKGFIFLEIRSNLGFFQQNVAGGETVPQLENFYLWRDPDFRMNTLNINVGYTYIFYKPTKRKE